MLGGAVVVGGRQASASARHLSSTEIRRLGIGGKAYIVVESEATGAVLILDSFERPLRLGRGIPESSMSSRYVRIADPVLILCLADRARSTADEEVRFWHALLSGIRPGDRRVSVCDSRRSGDRFGADAGVGKTVITCGRIGSDLDFEIQEVSVE
jgi:hypothetical protein